MSVHALEHAKDLHATDHMLNPLSGIRQDTVVLALRRGQRRRKRRLMAGDGVPVASPEALIPRIANQRRLVRKAGARLTKQVQVMNRPSARGRAQNVLRHRAHQHLKLQRVALFLPAVPSALLFLGRSHGTSEASTATMLYTSCAS